LSAKDKEVSDLSDNHKSDTEDFRLYESAILEAARKSVGKGNSKVVDIVFPLWLNMVHQIIVKRGCPCTRGHTNACFLKLEVSKQTSSLEKSGLSFEAFLEIIMRARKLASEIDSETSTGQK
jgi:hypothetical protein